MSIKPKNKTKEKARNKVLEFVLRYWLIIAGLASGIFALIQYSAVNPRLVSETENIRKNYTEILNISSGIIANIQSENQTDSLTKIFEIEYGKFVPFKDDKNIYPALRDFKLELLDFKSNRSNLEKLTYKQRCLQKTIKEELIRLQ